MAANSEFLLVFASGLHHPYSTSLHIFLLCNKVYKFLSKLNKAVVLGYYFRQAGGILWLETSRY